MTGPVVPGVPATGHIDAGGFWHPGSADGCTKGRCAAPSGPRAGRPEWCREHRRPKQMCDRYGSTHIVPR